MTTLYSVNQVSEILDVHYNTIYMLVRTKKLKAIKIGKSIKIPENYLTEFIKNSTIK